MEVRDPNHERSEAVTTDSAAAGPKTMKAVVRHEYGAPEDVLEFTEVDVPVLDDDRILVRVHASSANPADWHPLVGTPMILRLQAGFFTPKQKILGLDLAGTVVEVGKDVTGFKPGDEVYGEVGGAYAEYATPRASLLAPKPANLSFEQAAAVPVAGFTALQGLRDKGRLQPGQKVLINGASGGVGTFAVQIAKALGGEVTAVCSAPNVETARSTGADQVIDYTKEDFAESGEVYDLMFDVAGNRSISDCKRVLSPEGTYVMVGGSKRRWLGPLPRLIRVLVVSMFGSRRMVGMLAVANREDLETLTELLESGQVTPVIDRRYELARTAEALSYLGEGHARGKVVINF